MSTSSTPPAAWSGRFSEPVSEIVKRYTASIPFDYRLAEFDIQGSLAHAAMLHHVGVLSKEDLAAIQRGMAEMLTEIRAGGFNWSLDKEDVHLNIEAALTAKIGDAGKRLHTGRSRNDQVATDIRLYLRDAIDRILAGLLAPARLRSARPGRAARRHGDARLHPPAGGAAGDLRPPPAGLLRNAGARRRAHGRLPPPRQPPAAGRGRAGRHQLSDRPRSSSREQLGFDGVCENSLDAVSDRDFAIEFCRRRRAGDDAPVAPVAKN